MLITVWPRSAAMLGLRIPDIEVINVATTRKTLPDFVGMWSGMLRAVRGPGVQVDPQSRRRRLRGV